MLVQNYIVSYIREFNLYSLSIDFVSILISLYHCFFDAGAQKLSNACVGWIHVKDVVNAHIQAFEISSARGRYCLVESVAYFSDIVKITHKLFPTLPLPEM